MILPISIIVCFILAAICNAVMDTLAFKYKISIFKNFNPDFWNASISWRNKYKNNIYSQGPKFFGSTTFLVFVTDGWHLFQFLCNSFLTLAVVILADAMFNTSWWMNILIFIGLKILSGTVFEWFYSKIFRK